MAKAPLRTVMIDTNVVLDMLLARKPHALNAKSLMEQVERGQLRAFLCATTLTTVDYLASQQLGRARSRQMVQDLLDLCAVAPVTHTILTDAVRSPMTDFEDAVLAISAQVCGVQAIITRNPKDFARCGLVVYTPAQWLAAE